MKHVQKRHWMGCAVATAAMLADETYEEVAARQSDLDLARLRYPRGMRALLESVTDTKWCVKHLWFGRCALVQFPLPQSPVAAFLQDGHFGQWVAVNRDVVHDPAATRGYALSRYPRRDWRVAYIALPLGPAEFTQSQARRRMNAIRHALDELGS